MGVVGKGGGGIEVDPHGSSGEGGGGGQRSWLLNSENTRLHKS